jgi:long-chain acyl-CoA synthetase
LAINPLHTRLAARELAHILNDSGALAIIVDDSFVPVLQAMAGELRSVKTLIYAGDGEAPEGFVDYERLLQTSSFEAPSVQVHENDLAGIFYTGGTAGIPRGVMLTHRNLTTNAYHMLAAGTYLHDDICLHTAPMFHLANGTAMYSITWLGGTHTFVKSFEPKAVMEAIQRERVSVTVMVPLMISTLINHADFARYDLSSLRRLSYGGSPIPMDLLRKAMRMLGCMFSQSYGMTEASPLVSMLRPEDHVLEGTPDQLRRLASCGREIIGVQVRIWNEADEEVALGEVGEIVVRGPNVMHGYWNFPDETARVMRKGWYLTGDMGYFDKDGFIFLVDRRKDVIVSGGEKVYSTEVENAAYSHPAVLEAAVIGVPDARWGEAVKAVVVLRPGLTLSAQELIEHCRQRIAGFKLPKSVDFVAELPKSGVGKIMKRELRERYWAGQGRRIN